MQEKLSESSWRNDTRGGTPIVDCDRCEHALEFDDGGIYWTKDYGAHTMAGLIWQNWKNISVEIRDREFGYPISDELSDPGEYPDEIFHLYNQFKHGRIYAEIKPDYPWTNKAAHFYGPIYDKWLDIRAKDKDLTKIHAPYDDNNMVCYEVFNLPYKQVCSAIFDGAKNGPAFGYIQWNPETGTHYFGEGIIEDYSPADYEHRFPGQPHTGHAISDELPTSDGNATYVLFTDNNKTSAIFTGGEAPHGHWVRGAIWDYFQETGGVEHSHLVRAISKIYDEYAPFSDPAEPEIRGSYTGEYQDFAGGSVYTSFITNKTFETQRTTFRYVDSALSWTEHVQATAEGLTGNITLVVNDCSSVHVRVITNLTTPLSSPRGNYTAACALQDFDGRIMTIDQSGNFTSERTGKIGEHIFSDEQYLGSKGDSLITFPAMASIERMECRAAANVGKKVLLEEVVAIVKTKGWHLNKVHDLTWRVAGEEDKKSFWCNMAKEDVWKVKSVR